MADWRITRGAIVERPRDVSEHPLLAEIYDRHDALIGELATGRSSRTLEVAFGTRPHPDADVGIEAHDRNALEAEGIEAVIADARALPLPGESFDAVAEFGPRPPGYVPEQPRPGSLVDLLRIGVVPETDQHADEQKLRPNQYTVVLGRAGPCDGSRNPPDRWW